MLVMDYNYLTHQEAEKAAWEVNIKYISGIEIDCSDKEVDLDVIEYGINVDRNNFVKLEKTIEKIFKAPFKTRIVEIGLAVTEKEMMENAKGSYRENIWTAENFERFF